MTAIASTPKGHHVQPPHGPAEPPPRTTSSELTDEQRGGLCAHSDVDPSHFSGLTPFTPFGWADGKVATSADIKALNLWARCGRADRTGFDAEEFLQQHPRWDWRRGYLKNRPQQPWTYVESGSIGGP